MPVVIVVERLPVAQSPGGMPIVRRSVQHQVEGFCNGADALQGATEERGQVHQIADAAGSGTLERGLMSARKYPGVVRHARRVGAESGIVAADLHDPKPLTLFLGQNVAEHATLLRVEVVLSRAKLIEDATRNECRSRQLRIWMGEFLSGAGPIIF